jgi:phosphate transport system substrate-binding protein
MPHLPRRAGLLVLLALFLIPHALTAQDEPVIVVGSGIVAPLFEALLEASDADAEAVELNITGTSGGFEQFCQRDADIAIASRPISIAEATACADNSVDFLEILAGHNILTFVTHPDIEGVACLTANQLNIFMPPSATGQVTTWNQIDGQYPDLSLSINLPQEGTPNFELLDNQVEGIGLRSDATQLESDASIIAAVSETEGALGVVSLAAAEAAGDSVKILTANIGTAPGCELPSAENVESRVYGLAERLFIYVNADNVDVVTIAQLLGFIAGDDAMAVVSDLGFTPPTETAYAISREILATAESGRQFSREVTAFEIPEQLFGRIGIGGVGFAFDFTDATTADFALQFPNVTVDTLLEGEPAGLRRFCNGEIDLVMTRAGLPEEDEVNCEANTIVPVEFDLGKQAVVMVANQAATDYLTCLTSEQLATIWQAASNEAVTSWEQVNEAFPEGEMFLFAPPDGNMHHDLLLTNLTGQADPGRRDLQFNTDPLYRAAATGNVETGLALLSYPEYLDVLDNEQANIQLVQVDGGEGCVEPTEASIALGSYPLTQSLTLVVNQTALIRPEIQSYLWYIASDENYIFFEDAGLVSITFADLPDLRDALETAFGEAETRAAEAAAAAAEAAAQATAEATTEATAEANGEPESAAEATEAAE